MWWKKFILLYQVVINKLHLLSCVFYDVVLVGTSPNSTQYSKKREVCYVREFIVSISVNSRVKNTIRLNVNKNLFSHFSRCIFFEQIMKSKCSFLMFWSNNGSRYSQLCNKLLFIQFGSCVTWIITFLINWLSRRKYHGVQTSVSTSLKASTCIR